MTTSLPRSRRKLKESAFPLLEPMGRRLESLRFERGLTQRALAARANISANHYQDIAYARTNPTIAVVADLARALGVSLVELFESLSDDDARQGKISVFE